jgi:hypothetical protein
MRPGSIVQVRIIASPGVIMLIVSAVLVRPSLFFLPQTFQIQDLAAAATEIVRLPVNFSFFLCRDLFAPALSSWT